MKYTKRIIPIIPFVLALNSFSVGAHNFPSRNNGHISFRSYDGSMNNLRRTQQGAAGMPLVRLIPSAYSDGISALAGSQRPSAREVSNAVSEQTHSVENTHNASDFLWQWGQFIDHDINLTAGIHLTELANIDIPAGDAWFDPNNLGNKELIFNRSIYDHKSGKSVYNPRQQINEISAWIDASNVYGSDSARAKALRTMDGTGRLKTSAGNLLPFNTEGFPNAGGNSHTLFFAGDIRANEQVGLIAMHTLFVREHNRLVDELNYRHPELSGDQLYFRARRLVAAELQIITYREYLPLLLGRYAIPRYRGYRPYVNGSISNLFSTALYRWGHSTLSPQLLRLDADGSEISEGHLPLEKAFFTPSRVIDEGGIDPILRGLAEQRCQKVDLLITDEVRNFLFGQPGSGGFDLAALNIQRGRDHGLPSYNRVRAKLGLRPARHFWDLSRDPEVGDRLASVYNTVDDIDVWVGALAEDHKRRAMVGRLIYKVVRRQFIKLRNGDRFWYQNILNREEMSMVRNVRLSDIIRRNTQIGYEISDNVFRTPVSQPDIPRQWRRHWWY